MKYSDKMKLVEQEYYKFQLSFKGQLLENSVDAYDVANTIIALSKIVQEIAEIKYGTEASDKLKININAFKEGSLITDFLMYIVNNGKELTPALLPVAGQIYTTGKEILSTYKTYLDIRTALKGKQPDEVKAISGNKFEIKGDHNNVTFIVGTHDLRVLQSKTVEKNTEKVVQPLNKPDSLLNEIDILPQDIDKVKIDKENATYLGFSESVQNLNAIKYKGVISKIDTKANSGYLDIGSRRVPFNYSGDLPQDKFDILIESLRTKIQIFVTGNVTMDYESNPKHMFITDTESDMKLFQ